MDRGILQVISTGTQWEEEKEKKEEEEGSMVNSLGR
jgi:hypothetical protein